MENYKQLIKDYMIIECSNGDRYLIHNNRMINTDYLLVGNLDVYNDELKHLARPGYNVKRIYSVSSNDENLFLFDLDNRSVYWERPQPNEAQESFSHRTLRKAIEKYGLKNQMIKTVEELSELSQALCKALIRLDDPKKTNDFSCADLESIDNIFEEMADVEIMLSQCRMMFHCDTEVNGWVDKKIQRLSEKLEGE